MDRRKRKAADAFAQQGRFAGEDGARRRNADEQELYVLGLPATLFRDDVTAESVESNLLRWHADGDVLTDRFDVLLLLDEAQLPRPSRTPPAVDAGIEEQLDAERYRELDYSREHLLEHPAAFRLPATGPGDSSDDDDASARRSSTPSPPAGQYAAFAFDYGGGASVREEASEEHAAREGLRRGDGGGGDSVRAVLPPAGDATPPAASEAVEEPPYAPRFAVPPHLAPHLPDTERQHAVLVSTAHFVAQNGGQMEVVLRVRQAGNPLFRFLDPADALFPYYRWIVDEHPAELSPAEAAAAAAAASRAAAKAAAPSGNAAEAAEGASELSRLLHVYSDENLIDRDELQRLQDDTEDAFAAAVAAAEAEAAGEVAPTALVGEAAASTTAAESAAGRQQQSSEEATAAVAAPAAASGVPSGQEPSTAPLLLPSPPPPPPSVAEVIDRLVSYVTRFGAAFVEGVAKREGSNPLFAPFLHPAAPHHAYLLWRLRGGLGGGEETACTAEAALQRGLQAHAAAAAAPALAAAGAEAAAAPSATAAGAAAADMALHGQATTASVPGSEDQPAREVQATENAAEPVAPKRPPVAIAANPHLVPPPPWRVRQPSPSAAASDDGMAAMQQHQQEPSTAAAATADGDLSLCVASVGAEAGSAAAGGGISGGGGSDSSAQVGPGPGSDLGQPQLAAECDERELLARPEVDLTPEERMMVRRARARALLAAKAAQQRAEAESRAAAERAEAEARAAAERLRALEAAQAAAADAAAAISNHRRAFLAASDEDDFYSLNGL